jgi:tetratricopeptide (TPR) repeat protein
MIGPDRAVKVLDFGLAKLPQDMRIGQVATETVDGRIVGTPGYMAPEQAEDRNVDARADVFALGAILYEALTGRRPFRGDSAVQVLIATSRDDPEPASQLRRGLCRETSLVVNRCLAKHPADRFSTAGDLLRALDDLPRRATARKDLYRGAALMLALGLAGCAVAIARAEHGSPAPLTQPTAITDLPPPASTSSAAVASYVAAMQEYRDGDWGDAEEHLRAALVIDPSMPAAHLHLALEGGLSSEEQHEHYAKAVASRDLLTPRDREVLAALEPVYAHDPPDSAAASYRLQKLADRYPHDAELAGLVALFFRHVDPRGALEAARRALAIDPRYADAMQAEGDALVDLGRLDEARLVYDRCVALSLRTSDCRRARAMLSGALGQCAAMEDDLRQAIVVTPRTTSQTYDFRANALLALGEPRAAASEVLRQMRAGMPPAQREAQELYDEARLDVFEGDFATADRRLVRGLERVGAGDTAEAHARYAGLHVAVLLESGRDGDAAAASADYLGRAAAWARATSPPPFEDPTVSMWHARMRAGQVSTQEYAAEQNRWFLQMTERAGPVERSDAWWAAHASPAETREDGDAALAVLPEGARVGRRAEGMLGKVYLLADRAPEARPLLERATACFPLESPVTSGQLLFTYGLALERTGAAAAACAAYARLLGRWGNARPRSMTVERARERSRALECVAGP